MHPLDYPILADENIHPQVVESLRRDGTEITSIAEQGLFGSSDSSILEKAAKLVPVRRSFTTAANICVA
jgi:hypothetical protein